jgi:hypothetical protein
VAARGDVDRRGRGARGVSVRAALRGRERVGLVGEREGPVGAERELEDLRERVADLSALIWRSTPSASLIVIVSIAITSSSGRGKGPRGSVPPWGASGGRLVGVVGRERLLEVGAEDVAAAPVPSTSMSRPSMRRASISACSCGALCGPSSRSRR